MIWLLSATLVLLGYMAHRHISNTSQRTGLGFVRYIGVLCGSVGVVGIPASMALNPYVALLTPTEGLVLFIGMLVASFMLSHVGWQYLGIEEHTPASTGNR